MHFIYYAIWGFVLAATTVSDMKALRLPSVKRGISPSGLRLIPLCPEMTGVTGRIRNIPRLNGKNNHIPLKNKEKFNIIGTSI